MTRLDTLVSRIGGRSIAVVGDLMLDHFLIGTVDRISPEAPVPVVRFAREDYRPGGAANVAHNLHTLGANVSLVGLIGRDDAAAELRRELERRGLSSDALVEDADRPTTTKTRVVTSRNQQVARVDRESDAEPGPAVRAALTMAIQRAASTSQAIVLSDYRKGVVSDATIAAAVQATATTRVPVLVDPKVPRADRYRGVSLLTPNHHEAEEMAQMPIRSDADARQASRLLHGRTGASVVITRGEQGMWVFDASGATAEGPLPALAREVADVTGAGDTVIAVLALALAAGAPLMDAARLANIAAGLVVARFGPATLTPDELAKAASVQAS